MTGRAAEPVITQRSVPVWDGRLTLRVSVAGDGPPLLFLHPAAGLRWDPFLSHLAERFTVYAPEFPGTTAGDNQAVHLLDDLADVVLAYEELVRRLGLERPVVVGASFGGMLAAELAATFPALAGRLVLIDPLGLWRADEPVADWIACPPDRLPGLLFHDPSGEAAQAALALPEDPAQARAGIAAMVWAFGCTGKFVWPIPERGLRKRLHRVAAPTLIVWGEHDRLVPASYAQDFAALITGSQVALIAGSGHIPQAERFPETVKAVDEFLAAGLSDTTGMPQDGDRSHT